MTTTPGSAGNRPLTPPPAARPNAAAPDYYACSACALRCCRARLWAAVGPVAARQCVHSRRDPEGSC